MLAYDCVPPVGANSADTPHAIADDDTDGILVLESDNLSFDRHAYLALMRNLSGR